MSILGRLFGRRDWSIDKLDQMIDLATLGFPTATGKQVGPGTALYCEPVYACVRVIADTVSTLPFPLYRRLDEGGKERDTAHPLYSILHDAPNPEMTSTEFWDATVGHLTTWGNSYANIERSDRGVKALWPLRPDRMQVGRLNGELSYRYRLPNGDPAILGANEVMHIRALSPDGIMGYSPITLAREAIALTMSTEEAGARFFGNDSTPGGILTHPGTLKDGGKRLKESWESAHKGLSNKHRVAVLEEGVTWTQIGIPPEDAQFLETRRFQKEEIAMIFRVPPHMIGDLSRATFSNIEQQSIDFVVHSIRPWLVRIEKRVNVDLLEPYERSRYLAEFLVAGLLRGDMQSRYNAYNVGRQGGWLCADDIRELENMNPIPDGSGKIYLVPMNMIPSTDVGKDEGQGSRGMDQGDQGTRFLDFARNDTADDAPPNREWHEWDRETRDARNKRSAAARRRLIRGYKPLFRDAATRIVKREVKDVTEAAEKYLGRRSVPEFDQWLADYYSKQPQAVERAFMPVFMSLGDMVNQNAADEIGKAGAMTDEMERFIADMTAGFAREYSNSSRGQIADVVRKAEEKGADLLVSVLDRLGEWGDKRADRVARIRTVEVAGAVTRKTWDTHGVQRMRWVTYGKNCPYCDSLNGKVVGIRESFIEAGSEYKPDGADVALKPSRNIGHAPAHDGCGCGIAPEI